MKIHKVRESEGKRNRTNMITFGEKKSILNLIAGMLQNPERHSTMNTQNWKTNVEGAEGQTFTFGF